MGHYFHLSQSNAQLMVGPRHDLEQLRISGFFDIIVGLFGDEYLNCNVILLCIKMAHHKSTNPFHKYLHSFQGTDLYASKHFLSIFTLSFLRLITHMFQSFRQRTKKCK